MVNLTGKKRSLSLMVTSPPAYDQPLDDFARSAAFNCGSVSPSAVPPDCPVTALGLSIQPGFQKQIAFGRPVGAFRRGDFNDHRLVIANLVESALQKIAFLVSQAFPVVFVKRRFGLCRRRNQHVQRIARHLTGALHHRLAENETAATHDRSEWNPASPEREMVELPV